MDSKTTFKKTRVIGTKRYIDEKTGEISEMEVISIEDRDFNFEKIWLGYILTALDCVGNQKIKVLEYLLREKNSDNIIIKTQRGISEETGICYQTVSNTISQLIQVEIITMLQNGVYQISPNVIFKGAHKKRMNVLIEYDRTVSKKKEEKKKRKKNEKVVS